MLKQTPTALRGVVMAGLICSGATSSVLVAGQAMAQPAQRNGSFTATYALTLAGVSIGAANLAAKVDGSGTYALDMHAKLTGLAGVLVSGKGGARATGVIQGDRAVPTSLAVVASTSKDKRTLRMSFSGGSVSAIEINPPLEDWDRPDRVPVSSGHRQTVIDPLSALLMPARGKSLADACNRRIPVFDGATRFDVVLRYTGTTTVSQPGYSGPAATCSARYEPISGHRPLRSMTKFMVDNTDMGVTLIPVGDTGVYAPWRIHVRTTMGMSALQATKVQVDGFQTAASRRGAK